MYCANCAGHTPKTTISHGCLIMVQQWPNDCPATPQWCPHSVWRLSAWCVMTLRKNNLLNYAKLFTRPTPTIATVWGKFWPPAFRNPCLWTMPKISPTLSLWIKSLNEDPIVSGSWITKRCRLYLAYPVLFPCRVEVSVASSPGIDSKIGPETPEHPACTARM